jgi:hypothetical protein
MLSVLQRAKIMSEIAKMLDGITVSTTLIPERQLIKNVFPMCQVTFLVEGNRQRYWADMLHEFIDDLTHEWKTYYGNYSRATVSVGLESLDRAEIQQIASEFNIQLWKIAYNWQLFSPSKIEFRGSDPPRFLDGYDNPNDDGRTKIYKCVIDFFVEYEFSWTIDDPPITNINTSTIPGIINVDTVEIHNIAIAPGCYVMSGEVGGSNYAYSMSSTLLPKDTA